MVVTLERRHVVRVSIFALRSAMLAARGGELLSMDKPTFYEFFAGGGMARAGLAPHGVLVRERFRPEEGRDLSGQLGWGELLVSDVRTLETKQLPGHADLIWASFPCQDLSLAGSGAGLAGERSGTFWPFFKLVTRLRAEGRGPKMLVLENVCGALTSHGGKDFPPFARRWPPRGIGSAPWSSTRRCSCRIRVRDCSSSRFAARSKFPPS